MPLLHWHRGDKKKKKRNLNQAINLRCRPVTVHHIITHYNQDTASCFSPASIPVGSPWGTLLLGAFCRRRLRAVPAVVLPAVQPSARAAPSSHRHSHSQPIQSVEGFFLSSRLHTHGQFPGKLKVHLALGLIFNRFIMHWSSATMAQPPKRVFRSI